MSAMEYKIRKLKTVGLRQNAPEAAATRIDPALLHKAMIGLGGVGLGGRRRHRSRVRRRCRFLLWARVVEVSDPLRGHLLG